MHEIKAKLEMLGFDAKLNDYGNLQVSCNRKCEDIYMTFLKDRSTLTSIIGPRDYRIYSAEREIVIRGDSKQ